MARTPHNDFDFSTLSLRDLMEARDLYHFHLMSKANVVGTALGLDLIRAEEDWPRSRDDRLAKSAKLKTPRTLGTSQVRDYSWPCIIVLVREWVSQDVFGRSQNLAPWDAVPKRL